jgi:hypothetical protein
VRVTLSVPEAVRLNDIRVVPSGYTLPSHTWVNGGVSVGGTDGLVVIGSHAAPSAMRQMNAIARFITLTSSEATLRSGAQFPSFFMKN